MSERGRGREFMSEKERMRGRDAGYVREKREGGKNEDQIRLLSYV